MSEVKIYGHLSDNFENTLTNFNGKVYLTFYDKESSLSTLGTNPCLDWIRINPSLITPTLNGDYQARLSTVAGCKYFSNIFSYSLSIDDIVSDFKCYPNPSNEQFVLSWTDIKIKSIEIFNSYGQKIDELNLDFSPKIVNTHGYSEGFYLLKINYGDDNSFFNVKHIVKH